MREQAVLVLDRFCGRETHPIVSGTWSVFHDDSIQMPTLCIQIRAGAGVELHEDTKELNAEPSWEINVVSADMSDSALKSGARFSVPKGYDEEQGGFVTNFYYWAHEATEQNVIEILARKGETLHVRLSGQTVDVNYHDGSKPPTRICVEMELEHDPATIRSMS
jgi:hypothetical protein